MKPNTRLLIRFTLPNGDMKSWGYDSPYYKTAKQLGEAIVADLEEYPEHKAIHLFYDDKDYQITASNPTKLSNTVIEWLINQGVSL